MRPPGASAVRTCEAGDFSASSSGVPDGSAGATSDRAGDAPLRESRPFGRGSLRGGRAVVPAPTQSGVAAIALPKATRARFLMLKEFEKMADPETKVVFFLFFTHCGRAPWVTGTGPSGPALFP